MNAAAKFAAANTAEVGAIIAAACAQARAEIAAAEAAYVKITAGAYAGAA